MAHHDRDVAVIGAGTAGLAAERAARKAGASTLLIDPAFAGTTCATVGCMPSKLLLAAAHSAHDARHTGVFGIRTGTVEVDGPSVMRRVRQERDQFVAHTRDAIRRIPDDVRVKARARFTGTTSLALDNGDTVEARAIVIATGARPAMPPPFADLGERALTNETVFELDDLPRSIGVIGAGPIGLELAQAMARLGVETALFDQQDALGNIACPDVERELRRLLGAEMDIHLGADVSAERIEDGIRVEWDGQQCDFSHVLLSLGRPPNVEGLDLERAGIELDGKGVPTFCETTMQCGDAPIFVCGDANATRSVLHEASMEGAIAGGNAAAWPDRIESSRSTPFSMIFTDPPYVHIGVGPEDGAITGRADYSDQGRAKVEARAKGLARIYADRHGRLTGADLCAPGAEHFGHTLALAIEREMTASELLSMPFYHPTLEEGLKPALREICRAVPIDHPSDRSEGDPSGS